MDGSVTQESHEPEDTWQSQFLSEDQYDRVKNNPKELLQLVEQIALDRIVAEKETLMINSEQELYNLQQHVNNLENSRTELQNKLKDMENQQETQKAESEHGKMASEVVSQQKKWINKLEMDTESLKAEYRSATLDVVSKAKYIETLEKQIQTLKKNYRELAETKTKVTVEHSVIQSEILEQKRALARKTEEIEELKMELRRAEIVNRQQSATITELRNEKEQQSFNDRSRIEELEISNQKLTIHHTNAKHQLVSLIEKTAQLSEELMEQKEENNRLEAAYTKELELSKELLSLKSAAEKKSLQLDAECKALRDEKEDIKKQCEARLADVTSELENYKQELETYPTHIFRLKESHDSKSKAILKLVVDYEEKAKELQEEKQNSNRLTTILENIQQTLEEKAPIIEQQRNEFLKAQAEKEAFKKQCEKAFIEVDAAKNISHSLQQENSFLLCERDQLTRQVELLLVENERIMKVLPEQSQKSLISNARSSSSSFFRNVAELTKKNIQLSRDINQKNQFIEELNNKYKDATEELNMLRSNDQLMKAKKIANLLDSSTDASPPAERGSMDQKSSNYEELSDNILAQYEERNELKAALTQARDNVESQQAKISQMEEYLRGLREKNGEYMKQLSECKDEITKLHATNNQLQNQNKQLSASLTDTQQQCKIYSSQVDSINETIQSLKEKNTSLSEQLTILQRDKDLVEMYLRKFEIMKNTQQEFCTQQEELYQKEVNLKNEEINQLKEQKLEEFRRYRETIKHQEAQLNEVHNQLKKQQQITHEQDLAKEAFTKLQDELHETRQQLKESESRLNLLIKQGFSASYPSPNSASSQVTSSSIKLSEAQSKIESLEEQLAHALENQERYKNMLTLTDSNAVEFEKKTEEQLREDSMKIKEWEQKYNLLLSEKETTEKQIEQLQQELQKAQELSSQRGQDSTHLQEEIQALKDQCSLLETEREEYQMKQKQMEGKYEQEVITHQQDMESLQALQTKQQHEEIANQNLQCKLKERERHLKQLQDSLTRELTEQNEKYQKILQQNEQLQEQNNLLLSQLETLSRSERTAEENISGETKSNIELLEIIRSIQDMKNSLQTELTVTKYRLSESRNREERLQSDLQQYQEQERQQHSQQVIENQLAIEKSNHELKEKVTELEGLINQFNNRIESLQQENRVLETKVETLKNYNEQLSQQCKELEKKDEQNNTQNKNLQETMHKNQELQKEITKLQEQQQAFNELKTRFNNLRNHAASYQKKVRALEAQIQTLQREAETPEVTNIPTGISTPLDGASVATSGPSATSKPAENEVSGDRTPTVTLETTDRTPEPFSEPEEEPVAQEDTGMDKTHGDSGSQVPAIGFNTVTPPQEAVKPVKKRQRTGSQAPQAKKRKLRKEEELTARKNLNSLSIVQRNQKN